MVRHPRLIRLLRPLRAKMGGMKYSSTNIEICSISIIHSVECCGSPGNGLSATPLFICGCNIRFFGNLWK
jgi:hypothetical protein